MVTGREHSESQELEKTDNTGDTLQSQSQAASVIWDVYCEGEEDLVLTLDK